MNDSREGMTHMDVRRSSRGLSTYSWADRTNER